MDFSHGAEASQMKCTMCACSGELEQREITHTVRHKGQLVVIDHVPAEVCRACGETLLAPDAIRRIQDILESERAPSRTVPLYDYA